MIRELSVREDLLDANLLSRWQTLTTGSNNISVMYQSPEWIAHLVSGTESNTNIRLLEGTHESRTVMAASLKGRVDMSLSVGRFLTLHNKLQADRVLGNGFLGAEEDAEAQQSLLVALFTCGANAIHFRMLPLESSLFKTVTEMTRTRQDVGLFVLNPSTIRHSIDLPPTFENYLNSQFDSKSRYNLHRQIRLISEKTGQPLTLRCFKSEADVAPFLTDASPIASKSWESGVCDETLDGSNRWRIEFEALACRGLFRSYILYMGETPVAFVVGILYRDVFHFDNTAYDQQWRAYSPGIVLLYLLIQDLITSQIGLKRVSFGYGDHGYKRTFSNRHIPTAELLLYWKTPVNTLRIALYKGFQRCVAWAKNIKRKTVRRGSMVPAQA